MPAMLTLPSSRSRLRRPPHSPLRHRLREVLSRSQHLPGSPSPSLLQKTFPSLSRHRRRRTRRVCAPASFATRTGAWLPRPAGRARIGEGLVVARFKHAPPELQLLLRLVPLALGVVEGFVQELVDPGSAATVAPRKRFLVRAGEGFQRQSPAFVRVELGLVVVGHASLCG